MRISTQTMNSMTSGAMSGAYTNYASIINKIVSNKNFQKVSENVPDATRVLKLNDQLTKLNNYQSNIQAATNEMNLAFDTLDDVQDEISTINGLIVQASNATTTPESAVALADEIKERLATITDKMNQKYLDNYIFAGTYTETQPYQKEADPITGEESIVYKGSPQVVGNRKLTISEDTTYTYNLTGEEIFGKTDSPDSFFKQMDELDKLLRSETLDYDAIRAKIDTTTKASEKVTQMQGQISAGVIKLNATKDINVSTITSLTEQKTDLEEVDITKAASELSNAYQALQASYMIGTQVMNSVSLLDYI